MEYQNPMPVEGINTSQENPLKEFAQLLAGVALVVILLIVTVSYLAATLARYIPFKYEQQMVVNFEFAKIETSNRQQYLQQLADKVATQMNLPEDMPIRVHYSDDDTVNAFATLGGNLIFFKGLVDKIESEQELAAIIGHEIAHIKHRHPIVALGKGVTITALAAALTGFSGSRSGSWLIGSSANLSMLQYSRQQESQADLSSAKAQFQLYGHVQGLERLFDRFTELEGTSDNGSLVVELFRSHPHSIQRWADVAEEAGKRNWPVTGELDSLSLPAQ